MDNKNILRNYLATELKKSFSEVEDDTLDTVDDAVDDVETPAEPESTPTPEPEEEPKSPEEKAFEENPLEFILNKYPSLDETLITLLTSDYRDYITGIYIIAPKPTKFKVVLHNNQSFYLTYMGKTYEATISGKRYYLIGLGDIQRATMALSDLLTLGAPKDGLEGPADVMTPTAEEKGKEEKAAAAPEEKPAGGEGEEIELKESTMNIQNEAVKTAEISEGDRFTVATDMGKFKAGDKVTVDSIEAYGSDVRIYMSTDSGTRDFIIVDRNDDSIDLDYSIDESDIYGVAGDPEKEADMKASKLGAGKEKVKKAVVAYKKLLKKYKELDRTDPKKAAVSKQMVTLAAATKKQFGVDLETIASK